MRGPRGECRRTGICRPSAAKTGRLNAICHYVASYSSGSRQRTRPLLDLPVRHGMGIANARCGAAIRSLAVGCRRRDPKSSTGSATSAFLSSFAQTIVAELSQSGSVECAAGIRFGNEAFFSECYLDLPMEQLLQDHLGRTVRRDKIVEVSHLAAPCCGRSLVFVKNLIELLRTRDAEWAIFTATKPLRGLLRRNRLAMTELGCADRSRVPNPECWGQLLQTRSPHHGRPPSHGL